MVFMRLNSKPSGFTLVEMLVVAPIVILIISGFVTLMIALTGDILASRERSVLASNTQNALDRFEQDTRLSTGFGSISITPISPQGVGDNTVAFTSASGAIILKSLVTTKNPLDPTRELVYLNNSPNDCSSPDVTRNTPYTMDVVYFVSSGTVWRRTLVDANYATAATSLCGVPWQQPSCKVGFTDTTNCKAEDAKVLDNVATFTPSYYVSAGDTTAISDPLLAQTIDINASVNKTIAGRALSYSGTMRATRLNNALPTLISAQPTDQSVSPGATNVSFTASATGTSLSVKWQKSINNGADWTDIPGATNTTYTVPVATQLMTINSYRAVFNGGSGTAITSPARLIVNAGGWTSMALQSGWVDYSSTYAPASYRMTSDGAIMLKGLVKNGTATSGTVIATLPAGYRPSEQLIFQNSSNSAAGRVDIKTDGTIIFVVGANNWYSLDGISFMPSGSDTSWTNLATQNGWVPYGGSYSTPAYMQDISGRGRLKGLVSGGTVTNGTVIATLPDSLKPSGYSHFHTNNSNAMGHIGMDPLNNGVLAKGGTNGWLSFQALWYPEYYSGWNNLTLLNGFLVYDATRYTTPAYTKSVDGIVLLKGLIKGGSSTATGTVITKLPADYCPKEKILNTVVGSSAWARIDVVAGAASGCDVVVGQTGSMGSGWTSMDSISFYADYTSP